MNLKIPVIVKLFILSLFILFSQSYSAFCVEEITPDTEPQVESKKEDEGKLTGKINFDDVIKKAKEHSYDLKIADYNTLISKQGIRGARSEYFPKLNIGAGTEYTKNFRDARESTVMSIGDAFINPYTRYQSVLGINVGYNLFDFGVRGGNLKIAKEDVAIKELEEKEKLQEMSLTLLDMYTKILLTTRQIDINKNILSIEEKNLEYYERLYKAKEVSKIELNNQRVKVNHTKDNITELNSIRDESLIWLSFYTGEEYDVENLQIADIEKPNFNVLSFQDYTKSITWKIHEENIKKKEAELQVAKKTNYPKLNLYGRYYLYGADHNNYGKSFKDIGPSNFSVGASLNMPVFDGFKNSANIEKTKLELQQMQIERDKAIAQLMTKLAGMRSNLVYLDERINENNHAISELKDKEKSTRKLVQKKITSPIEYNEAKIELLNEEIEFEKNNITSIAITKGIQILTEEN